MNPFCRLIGLEGVPNLQDIENQSDERSTLDTVASSVDADCNNRQISECSYSKPPIGVRSSGICEPGVSNSDASLRSPLQPNRFRACPSAFHRAPHSTGCHRQARHHCNTVWLEAPGPGKLAYFRWFARRPHPSSRHNAWLDPLWSGCRFRFFLLQKGVQLIQFSLRRLFWYGCRRQLVDISANPIRHGLLIDFQDPANGSLTIAFHI